MIDNTPIDFPAGAQPTRSAFALAIEGDRNGDVPWAALGERVLSAAPEFRIDLARRRAVFTIEPVQDHQLRFELPVLPHRAGIDTLVRSAEFGDAVNAFVHPISISDVPAILAALDTIPRLLSKIKPMPVAGERVAVSSGAGLPSGWSGTATVVDVSVYFSMVLVEKDDPPEGQHARAYVAASDVRPIKVKPTPKAPKKKKAGESMPTPGLFD